MKRVTLPITPEILQIREQLKQETGIEMTYVQVIDHIAHAYLGRPHHQEKEMPKPITPEFFTAEHAVAMTLRDYFAAQAMPLALEEYRMVIGREKKPLDADWDKGCGLSCVAADAYEFADAMMAARSEK